LCAVSWAFIYLTTATAIIDALTGLVIPHLALRASAKIDQKLIAAPIIVLLRCVCT